VLTNSDEIVRCAYSPSLTSRSNKILPKLMVPFIYFYIDDRYESRACNLICTFKNKHTNEHERMSMSDIYHDLYYLYTMIELHQRDVYLEA